MVVIPWLIANSSWLVPAFGWLASEVLGWFSGGPKASISQIIFDFIKEFFVILKAKAGMK
jgi:hypothetical protein